MNNIKDIIYLILFLHHSCYFYFLPEKDGTFNGIKLWVLLLNLDKQVPNTSTIFSTNNQMKKDIFGATKFKITVQ